MSAQYAVSAGPNVSMGLDRPGCPATLIPAARRSRRPAGRYDATIKIGLEGLSGTYIGRAEIRDPHPPDSFKLVVDGKARGPGFVRATATITLSAIDDQTSVACDADVQVGGMLAAVGSRLIEAASRQQMDEFFRRLGAEFS